MPHINALFTMLFASRPDLLLLSASSYERGRSAGRGIGIIFLIVGLIWLFVRIARR